MSRFNVKDRQLFWQTATNLKWPFLTSVTANVQSKGKKPWFNTSSSTITDSCYNLLTQKLNSVRPWDQELVIQSCWQHSCKLQRLQTSLLLLNVSQAKSLPISTSSCRVKSHLLQNDIIKHISWICCTGFVLAAPQKSLFRECSQLRVMGTFHFSIIKKFTIGW